MGDYSIKFEQITKRFPGAHKNAVNETNLTLEEGSFVTILGASGCGKTTLLKMVNRIYEPTSGRILVQGQDITKMPVTQLRRKIGYVIQQIGLFPHMTVEENVATVPKILGWGKQEINERIDFLLALVHLPPQDFRTRYPRQLSGGQQQRVGLARAMAGDPAIMLMDEPFGAIDAITRESLQDELLHIQKKLRKTILFVTHDIEEALKLGDKMVVMNEGTIQQFATPLEVVTNPANEFVSQLVHADDPLQRLALITAESVMISFDGQYKPHECSVSREQNLKGVLMKILESDVGSVLVEDEDSQVIGRVTLEQLKIRDKINK